MYSQGVDTKEIKLTEFLTIIGEKHQVFFTYDSELLQDVYVNRSLLTFKSFNAIIRRLRLETSLHYDNLGNNYFVVYDEIYQDRFKSSDPNSINSNNIPNVKDFVPSTPVKRTISGVVTDVFGNPLYGASILEKGTNRGTFTNDSGYFIINTPNEEITLTVSFVGYGTKSVQVDNDSLLIRLKQGEFLDEVQIVGSRNANRTAVNTPFAIDVIDIEAAANKSGQVEINQLLQYVIPSFNASKQSGADGADHIVPASLRGLGPDQTLVLINGKRRHQSSLINLYGTRGRGNTGTDLNTIPAVAIKKIEILRDGASAQYGSDAIAGVINVVLNNDVDVFKGSVIYGIHNAKAKGNFPNPTDGFDGNTLKLSTNYGMKIFESGYLNLSTEFLTRDNTLRPGATFREKYGEAGLDEYTIFLNSEFPINDKALFYANAGYSFRDSESFAFTRDNDSPRNVIELYPDGFNPLITATIKDISFSSGFKSRYNNWNIDVSNTYGKNLFKYDIKETLNATLEQLSPTSFDAGGHSLSQNITGLDISHYYPDILKGLNLAFGTEFRIENYKIFEGEESSYVAYDVNGNVVNDLTPTENLVIFNGIVRPGGSQGFPGYAFENKVDETRSNLALYLDSEFDFTDAFMFGLSGRFETYSDFGNTFNVKLLSRKKVSDDFNIRGSLSTGFRAPSLAQIYYNLTFTNFIGSNPSESILAPNNSLITREFNIGRLKEEKAVNGSLGFTARLNNFKATIDGYYVKIKDRIILTGNFEVSNFMPSVRDAQFFANGVNTQTLGLDIIFAWQKVFSGSKLDLTLAGNFNQMTIEKINHGELDQDIFFGLRDQHFLLASAPKNKFNLNISFESRDFEANLNFTRFSGLRLIDWKIVHQDESVENILLNSDADLLEIATDTYASKLTTDFNLGYSLSKNAVVRLGVNNVFNTYPTQQDTWTDSGGYWDAVQMGSNGSFYYSKISYKF